MILNYFFTLLSSFFLFTSVSSAGDLCYNLFKNENPFHSWSFANVNSVSDLQANYFFPQSFITELNQQKKDLKINVTSLPQDGKPSYAFKFHLNDSTFVGKFNIWEGSAPGRVVVERLRAENPININTSNIRQSQQRKGLPKSTFYHVRNQLFAFLKAGGYSQIEVPTTQDLLTYFLYRKIIGCKPATEKGQQMADYLDQIVRLSLRDHILGPDIKSVDAIAYHLGNYFNSANVRSEPLWQDFQNDPKVLKDAGIERIKNLAGETIAIRKDGKISFVLPFLKGSPILSWSTIYKICPECMLLIKDL